jgi:hypothetical protein
MSSPKLRTSPKRKALGEELALREHLPEEMTMEIALRTPEDSIGNLCLTDRKYNSLCHNFRFWGYYFAHHDYGTVLYHLIDIDSNTHNYELFEWLWKNGDQIGPVKTKEVYDSISKTIDKYRERNWEFYNDLLLYIWKYAPISERSGFHADVVDEVNRFLKKWSVVPKIGGMEEFSFRKKKSEEEDEDGAEEFDLISNLILFTGEYYELVHPLMFLVTIGKSVGRIKTYDKVSRASISHSSQTVREILQQSAYLGYDHAPMMAVTDEAGSIESIRIDTTSDVPTLIFTFEYH